jgi:hypothetical protein
VFAGVRICFAPFVSLVLAACETNNGIHRCMPRIQVCSVCAGGPFIRSGGVDRMGCWSGRTARLERAFSLRKGPVTAWITGPLCVMCSGRQRGQKSSLSGGLAAEQPAGRTPGRHEHGRPARVERGVRWPGTAERCQHIVGVGVGYFPTAATSGFYRYTRPRTLWVRVDHHRRTRKAPGNRRQARRRKRERTGTCAARPSRLRLYGPS